MPAAQESADQMGGLLADQQVELVADAQPSRAAGRDRSVAPDDDADHRVAREAEVADMGAGDRVPRRDRVFEYLRAELSDRP